MFKIDNYVIDRVLRAYLLDNDDNLIGYLDQLTDTSIELSAETTDVNDAQGSLIKRFYRAKSAQLSATNALFNFGVAGLVTGSELIYAADGTTFTMPMSAVVKAGETVTLAGVVDGSIKVYGLTTSGSATKAYAKGTTASAREWSIDASNVLTPPTATGETQYFVYYTKTVTSGQKFINKADEFPKAVKIRIEVLGYDVCATTSQTPQLMVIAGDNFQLSTDTTIQIGGDNQSIDFSGQFASSYCSVDKELFSIMMCEADGDGD